MIKHVLIVRVCVGLWGCWFFATAAMAEVATPSAAATTPGPTLAAVIKAGALHCGVLVAPEDWTKDDLHGDLSALHVELCKAVGVAALGEKAKLVVTPYASEVDAEQALSRGEVDVAIGVTPTTSAAWAWQIGFGPPAFLDALTLLVHADVPGNTLKDLAGRKVCVIEGTSNERILQSLAASGAVAIQVADWQEEGEMDDAMSTHWCDAVAAYTSRLVPLRNEYSSLAHARLLDRPIAVTPAAPAYRLGDAQWGSLVAATMTALLTAESLGLDHVSVTAQAKSGDPRVQHLVGTDWSVARALGLMPRKDWAAQVVAVVGNYGEVFARTIGDGSAAHMPRGVNALWTQGGLMFPDPLQ
jgi:general L-amino acid transport system substrate-binding protein